MKNLIFVLTVFILLGVIGYLVYRQYQDKNQAPKPYLTESTNVQEPEKTIEDTTEDVNEEPVTETEESVPVVVDDGKIKSYTNAGLGITFKVDSGVVILQQGNEVFVADSQTPDPASGQSVEIFSKDTNDTPEQAIQKAFLNGVSETDCKIEKVNEFYKDGSNYSGYTILDIKYPNFYDDKTNSKCPEKYSQSNGISYFLFDLNHSDKFAFFSIGQYGINAGEEMWQTTFEFVD